MNAGVGSLKTSETERVRCMKSSDKPIVVEETFRATPESVWRAITEADHMRAWFFESIPDFKPVVGFRVEFDVDSGGRRFPHMWRVTRVVPGELIELNWRYGGYPGDSYVTFELIRGGDSTRLKLTHVVKEDFPDDVPEFKRESCVAGWRYFINQRLNQYLASTVSD